MQIIKLYPKKIDEFLSTCNTRMCLEASMCVCIYIYIYLYGQPAYLSVR